MNKSINTVYPVGQAKFLQEKDNSFSGVNLSKDLQFCKRSNKRQRPDSPTRTPGQGRNGYKRPLLHREATSKKEQKKRGERRLEGRELSPGAQDTFRIIQKCSRKNRKKGLHRIQGLTFSPLSQKTLYSLHKGKYSAWQIRKHLQEIEETGTLITIQYDEGHRDQTRAYALEGVREWQKAKKNRQQQEGPKNLLQSADNKASEAALDSPTNVMRVSKLTNLINNLYKHINHLLLTAATQPAADIRSIFKLFKAIKSMCCNLKQALKRIPKFLRRMLRTRRKLTKDELNTLLIDMLPNYKHWLRKADMLGFLPESCYNNEAGSIEWLIKLRKLSASVVIGMARACYGTNDLQSVAARLWKEYAPKLAKIKAEGPKVPSEHDMRAEFENIFINDKKKFVEWFYHPDCELQHGYTEEDLLLCETTRDIPSYTVDSMYKLFLQENGICNEVRPISTTQPTIYQLPNTTTSKRPVFEIKKQDTAVSLGNMNLFAKWVAGAVAA